MKPLRRIVAARVPWVAAKNPLDGAEQSPEWAVLANRVDRVLAAGRRETAIWPDQWANHQLIPADGDHEDENQQLAEHDMPKKKMTLASHC